MLIENRINLNYATASWKSILINTIYFQHRKFVAKKNSLLGKSLCRAIIGNERGHFLDISEDAPVLHLSS